MALFIKERVAFVCVWSYGRLYPGQEWTKKKPSRFSSAPTQRDDLSENITSSTKWYPKKKKKKKSAQLLGCHIFPQVFGSSGKMFLNVSYQPLQTCFLEVIKWSGSVLAWYWFKNFRTKHWKNTTVPRPIWHISPNPRLNVVRRAVNWYIIPSSMSTRGILGEKRRYRISICISRCSKFQFPFPVRMRKLLYGAVPVSFSFVTWYGTASTLTLPSTSQSFPTFAWEVADVLSGILSYLCDVH